MIEKIITKQLFLVTLVSIFVIAGILRDKNSLACVYRYIQKLTPNKRLMCCLLSTVYGVLPIPGRITIATGMFDTCTDHTKCRKSLGVLAYLSTHHYYLWSPLEKSVLIVVAALGISYSEFLMTMTPYIVAYLGFLFYYIMFIMPDVDQQVLTFDSDQSGDWFDSLGLICGVIGCCVGVIDIDWFMPVYATLLCVKHRCWGVFKYIDFKLLVCVSLVLVASTCLDYFSDEIKEYVVKLSTLYGVTCALVFSFVAAFILGSSSKFAGITAGLCSVFGAVYLPLFYVIDFCGYMLSPCHKCLSVSTMYFKTNVLSFYRVLLTMCLCLITAVVIINLLM